MVGNEPESDPPVDLAHEALLRNDRHGLPYWRTLRTWVDEYRKQLEDRRLLEILAEKWQAGGGSRLSNELARGRQLRDFRRVGAAISERAAAYLRASRRLRALRAVGIGVLAILVVAIGFGSWWTAEKGWRVALGLLAVKAGWTSLIEPEMIALRGGTFSMGSTEFEAEQPPHPVTVPDFAIGKYEVTFDEWDICVLAGGCNGHRPGDAGWSRGRRPVIYVAGTTPRPTSSGSAGPRVTRIACSQRRSGSMRRGRTRRRATGGATKIPRPIRRTLETTSARRPRSVLIRQTLGVFMT